MKEHAMQIPANTSISPGMLRYFEVALAGGIITGDALMRFVHQQRALHADRLKTVNPNIPSVSLDYAVGLLGEQNVISATEAAEAWSSILPEGNLAYARGYSADDICRCAMENESSRSSWRLVYLYGWKPYDLYQLLDKHSSPRFSERTIDGIPNIHKLLKIHKRECCFPQYLLIDMSGRCGAMSWDDQERALRKTDTRFERATEAHVAETYALFLKVKGEGLLSFDHWSDAEDDRGRKLSIGRHHDKSGLMLYYMPKNNHTSKHLKVCVVYLPRF